MSRGIKELFVQAVLQRREALKKADEAIKEATLYDKNDKPPEVRRAVNLATAHLGLETARAVDLADRLVDKWEEES